jgi:3-oxoacyl-[acyl-carrier protein] reductase
MADLTGKVAIVTGGSRGIGRGIAERLGRDGAYVVVNYSGSEQDADTVVDAIADAGGKSVSIQADLSKIADIHTLFAKTVDYFGKLDILVNNAGIAGAGGTIETVTAENYEQVFNLNVRGVLFSLQEATKHMANGGRIVNISSSTTLYPHAGTAVYAASKAAVKLLTQVMAQEVGDRHITVNTVTPGPTVPGMFGRLSPEYQEQAAASSPLKRLGKPEDIADVVAFLVSEEARWLTGQEICANGGATI